MNNNIKNQKGQTLIETVIAIFILTSGITAALGLAIFAFSSSQNITKQMIAVGLAREGIEAVKNMRDTNRLRQTAMKTDCWNPKTSNNDANCYDNWQTQVFNINPPGASPASRGYRLRFDTSGDFWDFGHASDNKYGLNFDSNIAGLSFAGFYFFPHGSGIDHTQASSDYARQIIINEDDGIAAYGSGAGNPFNKNTGYRLEVISRVWWADKKCPRVNAWPGMGKCSVELRTYLTNWKNY